MNKLQVRSLSKAFGDHQVLRNVSLELGDGQIVALLGPNGAGKSTLLRCIAGTVVADSGELRLAGIDPRVDALGARRALRYLPQESEFPAGLTGNEVLGFVCDVFEARSDRADIGRRTGLGDALHRLVSTYSVGMRRRLAFASLWAGRGQLFVLDEPFAGIDREAFVAMLDALAELKTTSTAVLMAIHEQELELITERLQPRFLRMDAGKIVDETAAGNDRVST